MLRYPSTWIPFACSIASLALVLGHVAIFGIVHETDEGTAAHLFQILMILQGAVMLAFLFIWLPRAPQAAAQIFALQVAVTLLPLSAVFFLTK
jgi:hypothetical protein